MQPDPQRDDSSKQSLGLAYGLIFGAGLGLLASVIFDFDMAYALVTGAGIGMIFGLLAGRFRA